MSTNEVISKTEAAIPRTVETVTLEIQTLQHQAQQMLLGYAIEIGRRLVEVKAMLPHGQWGEYIKQKVGYSQSTANNLMRIFEEYGAPQQSIFGPEANSQALGNLSYTKALQLLAIPAEEREAFVEENHVEDMSTRELDKAIRERDEARAAAEHAAADQRTAEQARDKMAEDMRLLNARLSGAREEREQAMQDVARLEAELADLKARPVEVSVETVVDQDAVDKARADAIAEMQAKLDKARDKQKQAEAAVEVMKRSMEEQEKAAKKAAMSGDVEMAQFDAFYGQVKEMGNKMNDLLIKARSREDKTVA
ncbi:DUF3102 domain-containing protein, partial [Flavonifractor sp. An306]|uniref:DUF3102 domain-containing protein n=1 Tax=Flavonifractor sp. An306 TaxID=1965629 RepID=UPI000B385211